MLFTLVLVALPCLVILITTKVLSKKYAKQLKNIPIPGELAIVFITTLIFSFHQPDGYINGKTWILKDKSINQNFSSKESLYSFWNC